MALTPALSVKACAACWMIGSMVAAGMADIGFALSLFSILVVYTLREHGANRIHRRSPHSSHNIRMAAKNLLRRLDLTTLQLFLAIFEEGTLTRAAEREAIAVSAASKRLLEL